MREIWRDTFVEESNFYVSRPRKIINQDGRQFTKTYSKRRRAPKKMGEAHELAVMPFRMLGADDDDEAGESFLGLGIADALIKQPARTRRLIVSTRIKIDKEFAFLRGEPRFLDILRRINLAPSSPPSSPPRADFRSRRPAPSAFLLVSFSVCAGHKFSFRL